MEFSITALSPETAKVGCVVVGVYGGNAAGKELTPPARRLDQAARGALRKALADLQEKTGSTLLLRDLPGVAAERVLLVSLGARKEFGAAQFRDAVRSAASSLRELPAKDVALFLVEAKVDRQPLHWNVRQAVICLRDAFYRFDQLKSQKKKADAPAIERVVLPLSAKPPLTQALAEANAVADGTALAKTLGNLPKGSKGPRGKNIQRSTTNIEHQWRRDEG